MYISATVPLAPLAYETPRQGFLGPPGPQVPRDTLQSISEILFRVSLRGTQTIRFRKSSFRLGFGSIFSKNRRFTLPASHLPRSSQRRGTYPPGELKISKIQGFRLLGPSWQQLVSTSLKDQLEITLHAQLDRKMVQLTSQIAPTWAKLLPTWLNLVPT